VDLVLLLNLPAPVLHQQLLGHFIESVLHVAMWYFRRPSVGVFFVDAMDDQ
jgi:hypothetical protein